MMAAGMLAALTAHPAAGPLLSQCPQRVRLLA
jgi:hypothetical protein